ncbi:hypothetical protein [Phytoactinopolyspora mesophila]|uniref:Uncharacterized protein n=1 Tax=Phytoactinopolyspora mesophila TaxID=2650750 RepID=A0A7K3M939_9ACTN|nr:hypothetical protein [Phytoactinopolyspora mesophila]NDL58928.1 hypothetical protein [Phytoactinopolyspora mesophila]
MRARTVVAGVVACLALLVACDSGEEPAGLEATAEPTAEPTPEPTEPAEEPEPDETESPEPVATFTQPYLPEESVVELRDEVPIEVPDGATDDEADVIRAFGRYYAIVEQHVWGVPLDGADYEAVATGERLDGLHDSAQERDELKRVVVGPPVDVHVVSVEVDGDEARLFVCVDTGESLRVTDGNPTSVAQLIQFDTDLVVTDGEWKVAKTINIDDVEACQEDS